MRRPMLVLLMAALAALAQPNLPSSEHGLHFQTAAQSWDEALPLGNGMLGALVWGDGHPLRISLDRADLWDTRVVPEFHGPEYKFQVMKQWHEQGLPGRLQRLYEAPYWRAAPTKIPAGRIELDFPAAMRFRDTTLTLADALASMTFVDGTRAEVLVHATQPVGLVRIIGSHAPEVRLKAPAFRGTPTGGTGDQQTGSSLELLGYPAPVETSGADWRAFTQTGAEGFHFAVYVAWRDANSVRTVAWSVASSTEGDNPLQLARRRVEAALDDGFTKISASHNEWWSRFWGQSTVTVPNAVIQKQWFLDTYKWGAASRRGAPPITLQAVWTADNGRLPPWKGDYHHDLNTELSYWPAYSGNHLEDGLSYLDWLWKTRDTALEWTREFYQLPGLNVPMTADLNGRQIGGWRQYTHSATTSAWLAQHFYLHWRYSRDREFLRDRAYPYLHEAAVFLESFTAEKDSQGKRTHPLSASPEINNNSPDAWFKTVTNYDLALERWLFEKAAELAAELGNKEDQARWLRVLGELNGFSYGPDGNLLVAAGYPLPGSHRHLSHMLAIHPLGLIDMEDGPQAQRTIRAGLAELDRLGTKAWTGYTYSWLANVAARARDGERAERALETFATDYTLRSSFHCNNPATSKARPFTLEGNFAAITGVHEMLLQSQRGHIVVFPAVPDAWKDAAFHQLRADGAFLVSAQRRTGKVARIEVQSEKGGRCAVVSPWTGREIVFEMKPTERKVLQPE